MVTNDKLPRAPGAADVKMMSSAPHPVSCWVAGGIDKHVVLLGGTTQVLKTSKMMSTATGMGLIGGVDSEI